MTIVEQSSHTLQIQEQPQVAQPRSIRCPTDTTLPDANVAHTMHQFARGSGSSNVLSFPFTFAVLVILTIGLALVGCGLVVPDAWMAFWGFALTLFGGCLYGWALCDEI